MIRTREKPQARRKQVRGTCGRPLSHELNPKLYEFGNKVRAVLRDTIESWLPNNNSSEDATVVRIWAGALGTLIYDVRGSVLLLLSHGHLRAPAILNRSIFEYQIRLRYYASHVGEARHDLAQMNERFKIILRAQPPEPGEIPADELAGFKEWVDAKLQYESFRKILSAVVGPEVGDKVYDAYYGKASGHVHGYETIIRDVYREFAHGSPGAHIDYKGHVFIANDSAVVCIYNLLEGSREVGRLSGSSDRSATLEREWDTIEHRYP